MLGLASQQLFLANLMKMKQQRNSLGCNPLSDASYRNLGMVLKGQGLGRHPVSDASYLDLDAMISEQGSDRHILSGALHRCPGVVENEQGSAHLSTGAKGKKSSRTN